MKQHKYINHPLVIALLFIPFVEPYGIAEMAMYIGDSWKYVDMLFSLLKWMSVIGVVLLSAINIKKKEKFDWMIALLILYQAWILIIALIRGNLYITNIKYAVASICVVILFKVYISCFSASRFISTIEKVLLLWIIVNFICLILFPEGMYITERGWSANWFLGYRNVHIYYYIPYLTIASINQYIKNQRIGIKYYVVLIIIIISSILAGSYTTSIAMGLYGFFFFIFGDRKMLNKLNMMTVYLGSILVSVLIIFFNYQNRILNDIMTFISRFIGRNISLSTMSSRTVIWTRTIVDISKHPITGCGNILYTDVFKTWTVTQAHNMFLDIVVMGGIILLLIFSLIIFGLHKKIKDCSNPELYNVAIISFVAFCILFITEARHDTVLLYTYIMTVFYFPLIIKKCSIKDSSHRLKIKVRKK